jgi:hypothetical protein
MMGILVGYCQSLASFVCRSEMVMLMMEETIAKAEVDIREKFKQIETNEAFIGVEFDREDEHKILQPQELNVEKMFGMFFKSAQADDPEVVVDSISTPRPDDPAQAADPAKAKGGDNNKDDADGDEAAPAVALQSSLTQERTQDIIISKFMPNTNKTRGDTAAGS